MFMQCKVSNRLTPPELHSTTLEEENTEVVEDTEVEEGVKENLAVVKG